MRMSALFDAKKLGIFEINLVSARTRGLSQFGHFADKGEGNQFFAILYGYLLWTAPYRKIKKKKKRKDFSQI